MPEVIKHIVCLWVRPSLRVGHRQHQADRGSYKYTWSPSTNLSATNVANPTISPVVAGTTKYYVTVTDNTTLCTSVDSMVLTLNPAASVTIASPDPNLCSGRSTTLRQRQGRLVVEPAQRWNPTIGLTPVAGTCCFSDCRAFFKSGRVRSRIRSPDVTGAQPIKLSMYLISQGRCKCRW
jgi:hypothetical protein